MFVTATAKRQNGNGRVETRHKAGVSATVVDVTVCSDAQGDLSAAAAHARKIRKYDKPMIRTWVSELTGVSTSSVSFTSLTFNWRGALSAKSAQDMESLGLCKSTFEIMSTRVLEGGRRAWKEARDATWIRINVLPSNPGSARDGHTRGGRRVCTSRPPFPVGPLATGTIGRPLQRAKKGRERHRGPGPAGRGGVAPRNQ